MGWTGCARILLFVFNAIFWLSGGALLGLGIYLLVSEHIRQYTVVVHVPTAIPLFTYAQFVLIAFGALIFLVGFCGCCGALRKSQCLLGFYIGFLVVIMCGELAAGVMAVLYKDMIIPNMGARLSGNLATYFGNIQVPYYTKSWEFVQVEMECCGVMSPKDFETSLWKNMSLPDENVPKTCCVLVTKTATQPEPVNDGLCQATAYLDTPDQTAIHPMGCLMKLMMWFGQHIVIVIGVGFGIAGLEIFGLIFAICMCREARKEMKTY